MAIRVTCPGCHTRFDVSDKFAGQEGPCPKCKKQIKIPEKSDEVVIHGEEDFGPKGASGQQTLKPIFRQNTKVTPLRITMIIVPIIGFLIMALLCRVAFPDPTTFPIWLVIPGAIAIAIPCVWGGYTFLRNQEQGAFFGQALWGRVGICSGIYALLWVFMLLSKIAFFGDYGIGAWMSALIIMFGLGALACMFTFEIDYLISLVHIGMYLTCCIVVRFCAGIGALPGMANPEGGSDTPNNDPWNSDGEGGMSYLFDVVQEFAATCSGALVTTLGL